MYRTIGALVVAVVILTFAPAASAAPPIRIPWHTVDTNPAIVNPCTGEHADVQLDGEVTISGTTTTIKLVETWSDGFTGRSVWKFFDNGQNSFLRVNTLVKSPDNHQSFHRHWNLVVDLDTGEPRVERMTMSDCAGRLPG